MLGPLKKQILILLTGIGLSMLIVMPLIAGGSDSVNGSIFNPAVPQCGHWVILRRCELLGVPIEMPIIKVLMPPKEEGASMLELRDVFRRIGLKATGKRETLEGLIKGPYKAHFITKPAYGKGEDEYHDPPLLYNLEHDPSEKYDISKDNPKVITEIRKEAALHLARLKLGEDQLAKRIEKK